MMDVIDGSVNYRQEIAAELSHRGVIFHFVGPVNDGVSDYARYSGHSIHELQKQSKHLFHEYPADIVMVNLSRDLFPRSVSVEQVLVDIQMMMTTFQRMNPSVTILVSQVIPPADGTLQYYLPQLNRELKQLAQQLQTEDSHVIVISTVDDLNQQQDMGADHAQLNRMGGMKMARKWVKAMMPFLY